MQGTRMVPPASFDQSAISLRRGRETLKALRGGQASHVAGLRPEGL